MYALIFFGMIETLLCHNRNINIRTSMCNMLSYVLEYALLIRIIGHETRTTIILSKIIIRVCVRVIAYSFICKTQLGDDRSCKSIRNT